MKNKKILGGLVVVAVLLSGTTVLYFAGVELPGVTPTLARPPDDNDCHVAGGFCAIDLGMGGGCNPRDCCPAGQSSCGPNDRDPYSFREIGSPPPGSLGSCWKYPDPGVDKAWCISVACTGTACPQPCYHEPYAPGTYSYRREPVPVNASCYPYY
jgi:hypothetical protein